MAEVLEGSNGVPLTGASLQPEVLLAVADPRICERFEGLLRGAQWHALVVTSAEAALRALEGESCIVVLDEQLPQSESLCGALREQTTTRIHLVMIVPSLAAEAQGQRPTSASVVPDDYLDQRVGSTELNARLRMAQRILSLERSLHDSSKEQARLTTIDALTGANNRAYFLSHLYRDLEQVRRFGGLLSVLVLDVDHFKRINDRYGHAAGDEVLQELSRRIAANLRDCDWHARVGDEEFAVVLPQTPVQGARVLAERLRRQVSVAPVRTCAGAVAVSTSIGIGGLEAFGAGEVATVERLFALACRCVHQSKARGRDCVTLPEDLTARGAARKY